MKPEDILKKVCRSLDVLSKAGEQHDGLFPSLLDRHTHKMLAEPPEPIPGQRTGDRSHPGSNLIHDEAALKTMYSLSAAGLGLGLLADLYDITGEKDWLDEGMALAEKLDAVYFDAELPRGAARIDWYESQMGPSFLQHGLARIALLALDRANCPLEADYTAR